MPLSMYQASVPVFVRGLGNLSALLDKASAHCEARKIDPTVLLACRLTPDMFPLSRQVQIACDFGKGTSARLAGVEVPKWADDEKTIEDLKARIAKTVAFASGFSPEQIDGSETREISITAGGNQMTFDGQTYLLHFALPNFYFHTATAYGLLRHNGVEIGKRDFLGRA